MPRPPAPRSLSLSMQTSSAGSRGRRLLNLLLRPGEAMLAREAAPSSCRDVPEEAGGRGESERERMNEQNGKKKNRFMKNTKTLKRR